MKKFMRFLKDDEGVTAIEYALIAALIAVAIITTVGFAGTAVKDTFQDVTNAINGV